VKAMMQAMLRSGVEFGSKKNRGLFQNLLREWDRLWVFVEVDGVEPTNNRAEQALRRAGGALWAMAEDELRKPERGREVLRPADAHGGGNRTASRGGRAPLPDPGGEKPSGRTTDPPSPAGPAPLNGY
jgi:hypothetical protein